ncbi:MAG: HAD family phosphatase [Bacteroidetes bacterium]|nr:HAD family phosphatase [Bacteroidota bacterium]HET6244417.1 HAD family phosphatase [Bacteroidia bacterium]
MLKIDSNKYKNIIFDLGGVILNIDYTLTVNAFIELGINNFEGLYSKANQNPVFDNYETGKINSNEFIKEISKQSKTPLDSISITNAWNSMLLDLPSERLDLLEKIKSKYRIFLLSNTNEIHWISYSSYLKKTYGFEDLSNYFEKQYLSFKIGMRKPNKEIFDFVLKENALNAEETVFIDDSIQHVQGALERGIMGIHLTAGQTILDLFNH